MYPKFKVRAEGQSDKHGVHECNWSSLLSLKDVPLLLQQDSCFPVKDYGDISAHCETRILKSHALDNLVPTNIVLPAGSASKGSDKKSNSSEDRPKIQSDEEEDRLNINIRSDKKTKLNKENTPNIRSRKKSKFNEEVKYSIRSDKKISSGEEDRPNIRASSVPRPRAVLSSPDNDAVIRNKSRVKALRPSPLKTHSAVKSRQTQIKTIHGEAIDDKSSLSLRKPKEKTDTSVDLRAKKRSATSMPHKSVTPTKQVQF